jgi:hypothetical protein
MSLCFATAEDNPSLHACLLLKAVFPAFADLFNGLPAARTGLESANLRLRLQTGSGLRSTLAFANGRCRYLGEERVRADIILHFLSDRLVKPHLQGRGFATPVPIRGLRLWREIQSFARLGKLLEGSLNGTSGGEGEGDPLFRANQSWLTLGVCLRAAVQLSRHEAFSRQFAKEMPEGYAEFCIGEDEQGGWIQSAAGKLAAGGGPPPEPPRVRVLFPDAETALDALDDRLDLFSAVGTGKIRVEGYLPLADALGILFERVPAYLKVH